MLLWVLTLALADCMPSTWLKPPPPSPTNTSPPPSATVAFPTLIPTPTLTPAPSATPTPDLSAGLGMVIFEDPFDINLGWEVGESSQGGSSLVDGRLTLSVRPPGTFRYVLAPTPPVSDFYLEVSLRAEVCSPRDEYGLMFRIGPDISHYRFTITCDGGVRVSRIQGDTLRTLVPLTMTSDVITGAPADNHLAIWASGSTFRFFINGLQAFTARDSGLTSGQVGFIVRARSRSQVTVTFDNLRIRALVPTPTPPASPQP